MTDRDDYWREMFGEDMPEEFQGNTGETADSSSADFEDIFLSDADDFSLDASDWFHADDLASVEAPVQNASRTQAESQPDLFSDTNVIPGGLKDLKIEPQSFAKNPQKEEAGDVEETSNPAVGKRRLFASGPMYGLFIIGVSIILAGFLWLAVCDLMAFNKPEGTVEITVSKDFTMSKIANDLKAGGLIRYKTLFKLYTAFSSAKDKIDPGTYELSKQYDYWALVSNMQFGAGSQAEAEVTVIEGTTMSETFRLLESKQVCTYEDLMDAAQNANFSHSFIDAPGDALRLEGYLFPDTYRFYKGDRAENVLKKFLNNFEARVTEEMRQEAAAKNLSLNELLVVASMIEKEAASADEMPVVASVIFNRIKSGWKLQIDATIQYILPERKPNLSYDDIAIDSPYNSYLYEGLPPGPIANPGVDSIKAALSPESTSYYYYALDTATGLHRFFTDKEYDAFTAFVNTQDYG